MQSKHINKYLENYAEPIIDLLATFPESFSVDHVVVIPAYKESIIFLTRFINSVLAQQNVLIVVIINQPSGDPEQIIQQKLLKDARELGHILWQYQSLTLVEIKQTHVKLLLVDQFTQPLPNEQGVGLARKIGTDLALVLIQKGLVKSTWIHSTDADAHLPDNYLTQIRKMDSDVVAACYNFYHYSENRDIHSANQQYESALRYYVAGLHYAGSPYAFFTIGSLLVFKAQQYAMVRGFPKRSAGEDFYLLNKLAKLGRVGFINDSTIKIDARTSDRVPFGTGPAVNNILALMADEKLYCYYHPQIFVFLKDCLMAFELLWGHRENLDKWFQLLPKEVSNALTELNFASFVAKQKKSNKIQFNKQLKVWFDAFKTLKFIHATRRQGYCDLPLADAISQANFD